MQFSKDIAVISRFFRRRRNRYMDVFGLKSMHARYLIEVCQHPGVSQDRLSQQLGIDKSNVARQATVLEDGGFLQREAAAGDKRVLCLYPTDRTLELLPGLLEAMQEWENDVLKNLHDGEKEQFLSLLAKVCTWVEWEERNERTS